MTEFTTIVITHEAGKRPINGFGDQVLGCEVVALAIGNRLDSLDKAETIIEQVGEMLQRDDYEKDDIMDYMLNPPGSDDSDE